MSNPFFERPIVNSPYEYPRQHWELDESGQPTGNLLERRGDEGLHAIGGAVDLFDRSRPGGVDLDQAHASG